MEATGFSEIELREIKTIREMQFVYSIDYPYGDDESTDGCMNEPWELCQFEQYVSINDLYQEIASEISEDKRYIICSLFGIMGYEKKTVADLSRELEVSPATIRNREKAIVSELRSIVA